MNGTQVIMASTAPKINAAAMPCPVRPMTIPVSTMMPEPMIMIGKLLPGWWLCVSIDNVFGLGTAAATGVDYGSWASSVGLVALFAVAFICLGLALGRIRRTRPSLASPTTTQLAK